REEGVSSDVCGPLRTRSVAGCRGETVRTVRAGLVRGRFRRPKLRRVLVLSAVRGGPWNARCDLFLGEHLCGNFGAGGIPAGFAFRPDRDHGGDAPALERAAHPGAADADAAAGRLGAV